MASGQFVTTQFPILTYPNSSAVTNPAEYPTIGTGCAVKATNNNNTGQYYTIVYPRLVATQQTDFFRYNSSTGNMENTGAIIQKDGSIFKRHATETTVNGQAFWKLDSSYNNYYVIKSHFKEESNSYITVGAVVVSEDNPSVATTAKIDVNGMLYATHDTNYSPLVSSIPVGVTVNVLDVGTDVKTGKAMSKIRYDYNGNTYVGWVFSVKVKCDGKKTEAAISKSDASPQSTTNTTTSTDATVGVEVSDDTIEYQQKGYTSTNIDWKSAYAEYQISIENEDDMLDDDYYRLLSLRHFNTLGYPPKFNMDIDIQYTDQDSNKGHGDGVNISPGIGRVFGKTFLSNPPILSICPGKVKMFPNLMGVERDNMIEMMAELATGVGNESLKDKILKDESSKFSGKLYQFQADTKTYGYYVNALCRACAIIMNIGDEIVPNLGTAKLKNFDYSYWAIRSDYGTFDNGDHDTSIFKAFFEPGVHGPKKIYSSLVEDTTWLNFFLNGAETSVSESIQTEVEQSPILSVFGAVNDMGSKINYFTGSGFSVGSDDSAIMESLKDALHVGSSSLEGIIDVGKNFMKGGKLILPKMVSEATYGKAISCSTKFISPYGNPISVFLKCIVPICHLLALALPKQLADNMYTFPFLVQANQLGQFHVDLGIISNFNITRGGMDNTSWTVESIPTEWEVTFDIIPLVDELMITGTNHPVLFCKNDNLLNYLGNMCGFNLIADNTNAKMQMITSFFKNYFTGYPRAIENALVDSLYNRLGSLSTLAW